MLFQENESPMLLEQNGLKITGKRSRFLKVRFFFVFDLELCPIDHMIGDYMTNTWKMFKIFRQKIVNLKLDMNLGERKSKMNLRQKQKERNLDERISKSKMRKERNFVDVVVPR